MSRRLDVGSRWGRWTVLKKAAPAPRYGESGTRARVHVRCVCGHEQDVFVNDLRAGKTEGCRRGRCIAKWLAAQELRKRFETLLEDFLLEA